MVFNTKQDVCIVKDSRTEMPKEADLGLISNETFPRTTVQLRNSLAL